MKIQCLEIVTKEVDRAALIMASGSCSRLPARAAAA
jgi:hypothetical protein